MLRRDRSGRRPAVAVLVLGLVLAWLPPPTAYALPIPDDPTIPVCGARTVADITQPEAAPPKAIFQQVIDTAGARVNGLRLRRGSSPGQDEFWLLGRDGRIQVFDARFRLLRSVIVPALSSTYFWALDPDGSLYVAVDRKLLKLTPTGQPVWERPIAVPFGTVYSYLTSDGPRIGVVEGARSAVFDPAGNRLADTAVTGQRIVQSEATGNLVGIDEGYVQLYSRDGSRQILRFGAPRTDEQPRPFGFYNLNAADQLADGTLLVSDTGNGLELFGPDGSYQGVARYGGEMDRGAVGFIGYGTDLVVRDGRAYYPLDIGNGDSGNLAAMRVDDVRAHAAQPQGAPWHLGIGAGPVVDAPGNYVRAGDTPRVSLRFAPWWGSVAEGLTGEYTVRDLRQVRAKTEVAPTPFTPEISTAGTTDIPLVVPSSAPGFYQVDVRLFRDGRTIGADCLSYGIAPPGADFDPAGLGEGNVAKVNLTAAFGQRLLRADFDLTALLSDDPNAPLTFPETFDADWKAAADAATARGVTLEVQIATGSDKEKKLVAAGTWDDRVTELVTRLKPYVRAWEPWNEPNATFGTAADFTAQVLLPAYAAVKAADPDATFVGGGILGIDHAYVDGMIAAGALDGMDALGVHPYTGHNRSFEEQGTLRELQALRRRLDAAGKPDLPIWDTESGFWNSPVSSYLHQGEKLVRKVVLEHSAGITMYANFFLDGEFRVEDQYWALWPGVVTPGGLAMVNFATRTRGLVFKELLDTGIPHTYAALYGPPDGDGSLLVAWADDFSVDALLTGVRPETFLDEWGGAVPAEPAGSGVRVGLSGAPLYAEVSPGARPGVAPAETFGPNLALAGAGARATATSETKVNPASAAVDGVWDTQNKGGNHEGTSAWIQAHTDERPELTVDLGQPRRLDRVLVSSQGIGSVQTGLRSYDVQLRDGDGRWTTVAEVRDDFLARNHLVSFPARDATAVRVVNMSVNFSGYAFGLPPPTWPRDAAALNQDDVWSGQAVVYELEAYAPGGQGQPAAEAPPPPTDAPGGPVGGTSVGWVAAGLLVAAAVAVVAWRTRRRTA